MASVIVYAKWLRNETVFGITIALCLVALCMSASLIGIEKRHECFIHKYENQQALVSKGTVTYLSYEDCKAMNNKIARHKTYCNNLWTGIWFSEEIGNLEPFVLKR